MTDEKQVQISAAEVVTDEVRLSFPALFEPKPRAQGLEQKTYQCTALLPPDYDLAPLHAAIKAAMIDKWGKVEKLPASKNPVKDCGDKSHLDGYADGWHFVNLHSRYQPAIVDQRGAPVSDPARVYAGMWVRIYMNAFAWSHPTGGKGVSFGLTAVQIVRDGERFGGTANAGNAAAVFGKIEVPEESAGGEGDELFG